MYLLGVAGSGVGAGIVLCSAAAPCSPRSCSMKGFCVTGVVVQPSSAAGGAAGAAAGLAFGLSTSMEVSAQEKRGERMS
jgi:hypothetical protein